MKFVQLSIAVLSLATGIVARNIRRGTDDNSPRRHRRLTVDTSWCEGTVCAINIAELSNLTHASSISMQLGSNGTVVNFSHVNNGVATDWYGESHGASISLVSHQTGAHNHVSVSGTVTKGESVYQIRTNTAGQVLLVEKKISEFPEDSDIAEETDEERKLREETLNNLIPAPKTSDVKRDNRGRRLTYDDSGSNIDVMVVWTKAAECKLSGLSATNCQLSHNTKAAMEAEIELMVGEANTAYSLSGINTELRLTHAYRHPTYVESTLSQTLTDVRRSDDEHLNDVHEQRTTHGADLVVVIAEDPFMCGKSFVGPSKTYSFAVVDIDCASGAYSFAHEVAHLMGARHDRGTAGKCTNDGLSHYGWRDPQGEFRTIMSYNCRTNQCDSNSATSCGRVLRFSNSDYKYEASDGTLKDLGNSDNNNAATINNARATIAAFYPSRPTDCTQDSDCDDSDACTHDQCTFAGSCIHVNSCPTSAPTEKVSRCPSGQQALDVTIKTDYYPCDTSWELEDLCGNNYELTNSVSFDQSDTTYTENLCIPDGKYKFTLHDYYGDGIWGSDCYKIELEGEEVGKCVDSAFSQREHQFGSC